MALPAAAAVVAQVPDSSVAEAALPQVHLVVLVEVRLLVLADLAQLLHLAADLVVEAEPLLDLLSRQSFSAAMARNTP